MKIAAYQNNSTQLIDIKMFIALGTASALAQPVLNQWALTFLYSVVYIVNVCGFFGGVSKLNTELEITYETSHGNHQAFQAG